MTRRECHRRGQSAAVRKGHAERVGVGRAQDRLLKHAGVDRYFPGNEIWTQDLERLLGRYAAKQELAPPFFGRQSDQPFTLAWVQPPFDICASACGDRCGQDHQRGGFNPFVASQPDV